MTSLKLAGLAAASAAAVLLTAGSPVARAEPCGLPDSIAPFMAHMNSAHFERSPQQQAGDIVHVDQYVLTHTELIEAMVAPLAAGFGASASPFEAHMNAAHFERSPIQQTKDIGHTDDYVLTHTVLAEAMLAPWMGGCGDPAAAPPSSGGMSHMPPATPPAAPPPAAPAPPAPAPMAPMGPMPAGKEVMVENYAFAPKALAVAPGTTVTWTNEDADPHTVTSTTGSTLKSPTLHKGDTYSHTFASPGTFTYYCAVHPGMKGSVKVA
jgi:plastocyanin